jgi:pyridoxamine 5'-phosphate oxidase
MHDRPLDDADLGPDPIAAFRRWYDEAIAAKLGMPDAMALATAQPDGTPSLRWVLLKGVDDGGGFLFYTSYESRKGRELAANPRAALGLLWQPLERQVRIEGRVTRVSPAEADAYWATRPHSSRVAAATSRQSLPAPARSDMDAAYDAMARATAHGLGPRRPDSWGGYRLLPDALEFWQGRANRFHDRFRFERASAGAWTVTRLWP